MGRHLKYIKWKMQGTETYIYTYTIGTIFTHNCIKNISKDKPGTAKKLARWNRWEEDFNINLHIYILSHGLY